MQPAALLTALFSVLFPAKIWFAPDQPMSITVRPGQGHTVTLVLTDFTGKPFDPRGGAAAAEVSGERTVDLHTLYAQASMPGTYVLFAVPKSDDPQATGQPGGAVTQFVGTPLVIGVRDDKRREAPAGAMVVKVEPLRYATIQTEHGEMTVAFYYDVAPDTADNFMSLAGGGFYDGLKFFRIVPQFIVQCGDPRGDGTGGPGYHIEAEFNDRPHQPGVLSMARQVDPVEKQGAMPRPEAANSGGSQFFICLNDKNCRQLDRRYTAFGRVMDGMSVVEAIGNTPVGGDTGDVPQQPQTITHIAVLPVTPGKNPYQQLMTFGTHRSEQSLPAEPPHNVDAPAAAATTQPARP